ncbi:MAG: hypothetical protein ACRDT5_14850 [Mycobacterium sp.]
MRHHLRLLSIATLAAAALTAPAAAAAPTCTDGDLQTRQGYQCSLAPGLGVTPGAQCPVWTVRDDSRDPFVIGSRCLDSY